MPRTAPVRRRGRRVAAGRVRTVARGRCVTAASSSPSRGAPAGATATCPISGAGSTWSQNAHRPVAQERRPVRHQGQLRGHRLVGRSQPVPQRHRRLRRHRDPLRPQGRRRRRPAAGAQVRVHADRRRWHVVHVQPQDRRQAGHEPAAVRRDHREDLHRRHHRLERPGDQGGQPGARRCPARKHRAGRAFRRIGHDRAVHRRGMAKQYASQWDAYCAKAGRPTPCGTTSNYPVGPGSGLHRAGRLARRLRATSSQEQNEGTITYVEYSYALNAGFPVAKVLNRAGYYVEPTPRTTSRSACSRRQINNEPGVAAVPHAEPRGRLQQPRHARLPAVELQLHDRPDRASRATFTANKGRDASAPSPTTSCARASSRRRCSGYSPLPINLVKAGLAQVQKIPGVEAQTIDIKKCNNPTFSADGHEHAGQERAAARRRATRPVPSSAGRASPAGLPAGPGPAADPPGGAAPATAAAPRTEVVGPPAAVGPRPAANRPVAVRPAAEARRPAVGPPARIPTPARQAGPTATARTAGPPARVRTSPRSRWPRRRPQVSGPRPRSCCWPPSSCSARSWHRPSSPPDCDREAGRDSPPGKTPRLGRGAEATLGDRRAGAGRGARHGSRGAGRGHRGGRCPADGHPTGAVQRDGRRHGRVRVDPAHRRPEHRSREPDGAGVVDRRRSHCRERQRVHARQLPPAHAVLGGAGAAPHARAVPVRRLRRRAQRGRQRRVPPDHPVVRGPGGDGLHPPARRPVPQVRALPVRRRHARDRPPQPVLRRCHHQRAPRRAHRGRRHRRPVLRDADRARGARPRVRPGHHRTHPGLLPRRGPAGPDGGQRRRGRHRHRLGAGVEPAVDDQLGEPDPRAAQLPERRWRLLLRPPGDADVRVRPRERGHDLVAAGALRVGRPQLRLHEPARPEREGGARLRRPGPGVPQPRVSRRWPTPSTRPWPSPA